MAELFGFFRRPVGAVADVRELEYVSALHQTVLPELREDGTISASDVQLFLRSRYGLVVEDKDAIDVVKGLCGTIGKADVVDTVPKNKKGARKRNKKTDIPAALPEEEPYNGEDGMPQSEVQKSRFQSTMSSLKKSADFRRSWTLPVFSTKKEAEVETEPPTTADKVYMDLVQMVGVMLIPTLLRANQSPVPPPSEPPVEPPAKGWRRAVAATRRVVALPYTLYKQRQKRRKQAEKDALSPRAGLIGDVLRLLLASLEYNNEDEEDETFSPSRYESWMKDTMTLPSTGRDVFPELNRVIVSEQLVARLLEHHGEHDAANDQELVKAMVDMVGGNGTVLDEKAFGKGLTLDVSQWPIGCEDELSPTFVDVYGFSQFECNKYASSPHPGLDALANSQTDVEKVAAGLEKATGAVRLPVEKAAAQKPNTTTNISQEISSSSMDSFRSAKSSISAISLSWRDDVESGDKSLNEKEATPQGIVPEYKPNASFIDYAIDNLRSQVFVISLFVFFIFECVFITAVVSQTGIDELQCTTDFWCEFAQTIWSWMVLAITLSVGGIAIIVPISFGNHQFIKSCSWQTFSLIVLGFNTAWPLVLLALQDDGKLEFLTRCNASTDNEECIPYLVAYLGAAAVTCLELLRGIIASLLPLRKIKNIRPLRFFFLPSDIRRSRNTKRSGTHKLNGIIEHAHKIHRQAHHRHKGESAAKLTMLNFMLHGEKLEDCGGLWWVWKRIFLSGDLIKKEGVWIHVRFLVGQTSQWLLLVVLIFVWWFGIQYAAESAEDERKHLIDNGGSLTDFYLRFVPTENTIYYSCIPGGIVAFSFTILLILVYLPSTCSLILKFRSGVIPSLHDKDFFKYRKAADSIYYNLGNMIYALLGSSLLFFLIFAGALFLILWPITQDFMFTVIAWGLGLGITIAMRMLLTMRCRSLYYQSFYRKKPLRANLSSIAMECWHLGIGGGVMIGRLTQFLLAAAFWIGRIDSTFLSDDVQVFGYRFDFVPINYRQELLVHDAHRHPFIERLAAMYLMRLKHGNYFASNAGAAWRNLFVVTLMPWILKYRKGNELAEDYDDEEEEFGFASVQHVLGGASNTPVMIENLDQVVTDKEDKDSVTR